jgi:LmbE family N-acetylglucosaminyl deacetylase
MKNLSRNLFRFLRIGLGLVLALSFLFLKFTSLAIATTTQGLLNPGDRILILAPHPDDEVLGCAGIIQQAVKNGLKLKIVFLTYGDNNQWSFLVYRKHPVVVPKAVQSMGLVRHNEAREADKVLGVSPKDLIFLGYPDFRTLDIWYAHWGSRPAAESMLTHVRAVPYDNAFRPGAAYKADDILSDLKGIIRDFRPSKIFLSHPADHNPDHRALYLFTQIALWDLRKELKVSVYPYLVHFKDWPHPLGYYPDERLMPPDFFAKKILWQIQTLTPDEVKLKLQAIQKHRSQLNSAKKYLLSFIRPNELFGDYPVVKIKPDQTPVALSVNREAELREVPEMLLDEERVNFMGVQEERVYLEDDAIVFSLTLSRAIGKTAGVSLFVFGYRKDIPFSAMPKLHIKFGTLSHKILDQDTILPVDTIKVERSTKGFTIHIPLRALGQPQRILTSVHTYELAVPLDWVSWRILELQSN